VNAIGCCESIQKAVASAKACRFYKSVGRHRNWSLPHAAAVRFDLLTATGQQRQQRSRSIPLIPDYKTDAEFKVRTASLGERFTLAGAARLRAQTDYKKWTLWGILILGGFVLAAMAYRLARQVKTTPADETDNSK